MQNVRTCKQCGEVKQLNESNFRPYYGDSARGYYRVCKTCESINNRYKYLKGKGDAATCADVDEISKIEELYDTLRELGLEPPRYGEGTKSTMMNTIDNLLARKKDEIARRQQEVAEVQETVGNDVEVSKDTPDELLQWLTNELTKDPEYYEDVYFKLREKYMPVIGLDESLQPLYDETYKEILDKILERFDEYEDEYYD